MDFFGLKSFFQYDLWRIDCNASPWWQAFVVRFIRTLVLTLRGRVDHRIALTASGLTYYSLVSVVPALALIFGIGQGFGFQKAVERELMSSFPGQEEAVGKVVGFARAVLENVQGGLIAGVGFVILFFSIYRVLSHTETTFNHIWGVKNARTLARRATDYLAVMIFFPIFLVASGTATVFIASEVTGLAERASVLDAVDPLISLGIKSTPFLLMWLVFTVLYIFLPNTKVKFIPGVIAGVAAGTVFQLFQKFYITSQIFISRYNAVYGSFAALPMFLLWLEISWLIVLFGAEACCAMQNLDSYEAASDRMKTSHASRRLLVLRVAHLLVRYFASGEKNITLDRIAMELEMPKPLASAVLDELLSAGLISRIAAEDDWSFSYQPAIDPDLLTISKVVEDWEAVGDDIASVEAKEAPCLRESWETLIKQARQSPANRKLKEI